ncbi:MAG: DUF2436 domain-containing protein [Muribaculaceae bacterium]|nr:DUF2436 domain-containing protein [Muribaculaceae bacterium]
MKKVFFIALMTALAIPSLQAHHLFPTKALEQKAQSGSRHTDRAVTSQAKFKAPTVLAEEIPEGMAMVTLAAGDIWSDHSGYQMLLDADATAFGTLFPETGPLTQSGDADDAVYAEFEYKIPENADGLLTTENIVVGSSVSILIPAGVYDYVITNPCPGSRVFIASPYGSIGGRYNDFTFEAGKSYTFTVYLSEEGYDATDLTITSSGPEVAPTMPENVTVVPSSTSASVKWADIDDSKWNLRYRRYNPDANPDAEASYFWDFEDGMGDWTSIDADGDGNDWMLYDPVSLGHDPGDGVRMFGTKCMASASYLGTPLTPDNWLISPKVTLNGDLTFWAAGQDASWAAEVFAVYVTTGDPNNLEGYVKISDDITAQQPIKEYTFNLADYAGQEGYVAIRHYNVTDMFRLNIDNVSIGSQNAPATWIEVKDITNRYYTIEGLDMNTTYEVQVQAVNGVGESDWTESNVFTTLSEEAITEVYVNGYESPIAGENSQDHLNLTVPEGANYQIYVTSWSPEWWDNDVDDEFFGIFVNGTRYSIGMTLQANDGYYFADNCKFYVNGSQDLVDNSYTGIDEENNTYAYVWTVPEVASDGSGTTDYLIHEVRVDGYESPVAGQDSQEHLNITVPEGVNYHIYANKWSPEWWDNDADDDFFGIFVEGTYYSVGMTLEANEGYSFADDCKFYVNGSEVLVDTDFTYVDSDEGGTYAYLWTIPEQATPDYAIHEVYVNGYESPVTGQDSQEHLNITVPDDANYHIFANKWSPEWWDNDADDDFFGIFVEGTYYSVGMTLEANEGYHFAEDCVFYVNGGQELVDTDFTYVETEDGSIYAYVWTIPEVAMANTGIEDMNGDKTVAGVRYYNLAGQQIQKAEGVTIVVTTYTDGTTSAVKVVK